MWLFRSIFFFNVVAVSYDEKSENCSETKEESSETQGSEKKEYPGHPGEKCLVSSDL